MKKKKIEIVVLFAVVLAGVAVTIIVSQMETPISVVVAGQQQLILAPNQTMSFPVNIPSNAKDVSLHIEFNANATVQVMLYVRMDPNTPIIYLKDGWPKAYFEAYYLSTQNNSTEENAPLPSGEMSGYLIYGNVPHTVCPRPANGSPCANVSVGKVMSVNTSATIAYYVPSFKMAIKETIEVWCGPL